ncbi:MAG: hypothetical protein AAFZ63_24475 [Bacteroidota bacterium]
MIDLNQYKDGSVSKEELEEFTNAFMRAKYDNDRKERWQGLLASEQNFGRQENTQATKRISRRVFLWAASAAAVALIAVLLLFGPGSSPASYEQLADNYLSEEFYENREDDSRGDQDVEQMNVEATVAYNQKDFATAIARYETIIARGQGDDTHHFFLGLSYLYTAAYEEAIRNFLKVPELNPSSKFIQEHRWFLALAYLKNMQVEECKSMLQAIQPRNWKYQEAQELLKAIDR